MRTISCVPRKRITRRIASRRQHREDGAVAIMFLGFLPVIIGFCGLALELAQVYNRKIEMQNVADTAALAAAFELDGTSTGISNAVQKASARFTAAAPSELTYGYSTARMDWSDSAIEFSTTPRGPWISYASAAAKASPNGLLYVKVDTGGLDASYGQVNTVLMQFLSKDLATVSTGASAIAGRSGIAVTPLGICIMRPEASRNRNGELEEYGFRRGISYDLMQLNPGATTGGQTFLIDPFIGPGASGSLTSDTKSIAPFVCTGTMAVARVTGGAVSVSSPFPIGTLYQHLNSRFDSYTAATAPCSPDSAPPDTNIKAYAYNTTGAVPWMSTALTRQEAAPSTADGKLWTVAGPDPTPSGTTAGQFGVLWSYAKAVNYAASPPAGGYTAYDTSSWSTLYNPGQPKAAASYPSVPPYFKTGYTKSPTHMGMPNRRVLNVPLLSCPVSGNSATISGIGRFFMTVPSDGTHLYAEFAGLVQEQTLRVQVRLYQ
jgi:Flp pilus assembly protein TadG